MNRIIEYALEKPGNKGIDHLSLMYPSITLWGEKKLNCNSRKKIFYCLAWRREKKKPTSASGILTCLLTNIWIVKHLKSVRVAACLFENMP